MTDKIRAALATTLTLVLLGLAPDLVRAQTADEQAQPEPTAEEAREARRLEKERAKEARIEEYLRKKEERRAKRDLERQLKEQEQEAAAAEAAADEAVAPKKGKPETRGYSGTLPKDIRRIHELVMDSPLGEDPTVRAYLELIEAGEASPEQIAAFGNFLGDAGMVRAAIAYYGVALEMDKSDSLLWLNVGTLHRKAGEFSAASSAYARSLTFDPTNAYAHYNLGAVMDEMGRYEDAIREYKMALTLDPSLGDPAVNPQAANNDRLLAVQLMLYKEQAGSLGLPLVELPGGGLEPDEPSDD